MSKNSKKLKKLRANLVTEVVVSPRFLSDLQVFATLGLLCLLLYARSLFFGFTYLDDNVLILDNLAFLQNFSNLGRTFTQEVFHILHSSASYYRPILTISFMVDAVIAGALPFMYHLSNVLYHLAATWLVYKFFLKLKYSQSLALLFSLIFIVHPVLTQAVAWVPGRNDSLMTIFALATFIWLLTFWEDRRLKSLFWGSFYFALAIFTKETALVIPVIFAFYLILTRGRVAITELKNRWGVVVGWGVIGIIWVGLRHIALGNSPLPLSPLEMVKSIIINSPATVQFIGKVFFPFNLSVLPIMRDTTFGWGILAVLVLLGLVIWEFMRGDPTTLKLRGAKVLFGLLWFLAFLLPSFIRPDTSTVADFIEHRVYLPVIGLFIILAETKTLRHFDFKKPVYRYVGLGVLGLFFILTFFHEGNFASRLSFWKNAAATSPHSPLAQRNLGAMYYLDGQLDQAEDRYRRSLALNPTEQMVHNNLGLIYAARNQNAAAFNEYQAELAINPNYDNAHFNLGLLYYKENKLVEAKAEWEKTLQYNPDYQDAAAALKFLEASESGKTVSP